jgi:FkbM family methyltransferase
MKRELHEETARIVKGLRRKFQSIAEESRAVVVRRCAEHLPSRSPATPNRTGSPPGRLDYPRAAIYLKVTSDAEVLRLRACTKEPWTVEWIEGRVGPGEVLYDIGANVGAFSLVAAKRPRGPAHVVAFEPGYANFSALCDNIVLNDAADAITPMPIGLSAETKLATFNYRKVSPGTAVHAWGERKSRLRFQPEYRQRVLTYRLDDLISQFDLPPPNHVKIDVDGSELSVLQGASHCLDQPNVRTLMIEVERHAADAIVHLLGERGFSLARKFEKYNPQGDLMSIWYGLFAR